MTTALEVQNIHQTYMVSQGVFRVKKPLRAVNGVSLQIKRGEVLGLVGESGCGKSTLAKIMLGLLAPTEGDVLLKGSSITLLDRLQIAKTVQPIFQDPYSSLNPRKSVGAIITLPLRAQSDPNTDTWRKRVEHTMDMVGLPKRMYGAYPNQLSGGQRQRVAIARALINRPEIVICDEPTSALDVSVQSQILNLLGDLRQELGLTYVIISHDLAVVEHMATRVAVMYLGRMVDVADTNELFAARQHPYTQALLDSVLTPDPALGLPNSQLGMAYPNPIDPPQGCTFHPRCVKKLDKCEHIRPTPVHTGSGVVECHLYE